jgi:tRNA A-37 threonylcarbamoyl transferase component Bud32
VFGEIVDALMRDAPLPAEARRMASSASTRVARLTTAGKNYYVKVFLPRGRLELLKRLVIGSRAQRATRAADTLAQAGFHTPAVVASGDRGSASWLITEAVAGVGLGIYADVFLRGPLSPARLAWKRSILRAFGDLVGRLHRQGIIHGDLRLNNVLIDVHSPVPVFYLIDNERNRRFKNRPPRKLIVKNLVQASLLYPVFGSRADRLRFFQAYAAHFAALTGRERRDLMRDVQGRSELRLDSLARRSVSPRPELEKVYNVPA